MTSCQVTVFITAVANIIAEDKSADELGLLAAMLTQLGDTLATIAVIKEASESPPDSEADLAC
ncbi:hypothetical protein Ami103574_10580 [Aminipila butyrica]|uniref:DUF6774 domain-containing protein n=1 Tax=Aminipila butyrica TaxID=433296 RepID=A0A858BX36_9FIRM|nr:DUF6774 domain-containing protein [Aminipila butyrica]QIB69739.1 hypothetical protein Ami103574_10580 [Aminipila butyrica]